MLAATFRNELIFSIHLKAIEVLLTFDTEPGFKQLTKLRTEKQKYEFKYVRLKNFQNSQTITSR